MASTSPILHVLVIAHPDDESMFFVPTLRSLKARGETFWILCLTTGDYDGLGAIRSKEMHQAGVLLGAEKTIVCDTLKDHPTQRWNIEQVQHQIQEALRTSLEDQNSWSRLILMTFDDHGVSGHVNHIDTYHGVCALLNGGKELAVPSKHSTIPIEAWTLRSEKNLVSKYIPLVSWVLLFLSLLVPISTAEVDANSRTYRLFEPYWNWKAMTTHQSQFVWYRRLFVVFSCYTYVNILTRVEPKITKKD